MGRSYTNRIKDYFYYSSRPVCAKEVMDATGTLKSTCYQAVQRLHRNGFLRAVKGPGYPNKYYVVNMRVHNPLDSWMPNPELIEQIMTAIGKGATFSKLLKLSYSKETITIYLRALYAEKIIGCKKRKYYLIEKDINKVQLGDLKSYPTLKELKKSVKIAVPKIEEKPAEEEPAVKEPDNWNQVWDQVEKRSR